MAWPLDAKHTTTANDGAAHSVLFNEIQDRIVDLHRLQTVSLVAGLCDIDVSNDPAWKLSGGGAQQGWECRNTNSILLMPVEYRIGTNSAAIKQIEAKVYNTSTASIQMDLHIVDLKMSDTTTAPVMGSSEGGIAAAEDSSWEILSVSGIDVTIGSESLAVVIFTLATQADLVAAVQVDIEPLTPST